jgi:MoaE-MoaD fusion protein
MLQSTMQVQLLLFGILKETLGPTPRLVDLPEGSTVADLLDSLSPLPASDSIAVSVNTEFAQPNSILHNGDEVGLLPPVSGGAPVDDANIHIALTRNPIDTTTLVAAARHAEDGAVVVFDGIVRNNSRGRRTLHLDYEAYEPMAEKQMRELALEARSRFGVRHVVIVHRLGHLEIGETSVLIVVASAHRAQAYEASRWLIDTLKKTVPIWKHETFADGAVWAPGEPFPEEIAISRTEAAHG